MLIQIIELYSEVYVDATQTVKDVTHYSDAQTHGSSTSFSTDLAAKDCLYH